jgi:N-acyl-D-amino-acid deacylase
MRSVAARHRTLIAASLILLGLLPAGALPATAADEASMPTSGKSVVELACYDTRISGFLRRWNIPGGAVAVTHEGKLVLARGYGWANVQQRQPVEPTALFRLASVSKPITAVAVLRLIEQRRIKLEDRIVDHLGSIDALKGPLSDDRFRHITIEQLLWHTGGWDRARSFDPMFRSTKIAEELGVPAPADSLSVVRYMLARPLDFTPGERYCYSNFGYCLLGRVIEAATGQPYESAVRQLVLEHCGASGLRQGRTRADQRAPTEVSYYTRGDSETTRSVFPDVPGKVAWPDGGFYLEAMDAHGGWIGSAVDVLRFLTALDGGRSPALLEPATIERMAARGPHTPPGDSSYYALGWQIRPQANGANWWHSGSLPGTSTLLVHTSAGFDWAILLNARPEDVGINEFHAALDKLMWQAFAEVTSWPQHDLFADFPVGR